MEGLRYTYNSAQIGVNALREHMDKIEERVPEIDVRKLRSLSGVVEGVIERSHPKPLKNSKGVTGDVTDICTQCGAVVPVSSTKEGRKNWQFCPMCGQRFRGVWQELREV